MPDALDQLAAEVNTAHPGYAPPQPQPPSNPGAATSAGSGGDALVALAAEINAGKFAPPQRAPGAPAASAAATFPRTGGPDRSAPPVEGTLSSALSGAADTASFGLMDEAFGLLETLGVTAGTDATSVWSSGKSFGDRLSENIAYERAQANAKRANADRLRNVPLGDLVSNSDLYRANGIDPQAYSDRITEGAAGELLGALHGDGR